MKGDFGKDVNVGEQVLFIPALRGCLHQSEAPGLFLISFKNNILVYKFFCDVFLQITFCKKNGVTLYWIQAFVYIMAL